MGQSVEDIVRARTHDWYEINDQTEMCGKCLTMLDKSTPIENIPECPVRTKRDPKNPLGL
jgi:hypothetical protein